MQVHRREAMKQREESLRLYTRRVGRLTSLCTVLTMTAAIITLLLSIVTYQKNNNVLKMQSYSQQLKDGSDYLTN